MRRVLQLALLVSVAALACQGDSTRENTTTPGAATPSLQASPTSPEPTSSTSTNERRARVQALIDRSQLLQVACLDVNHDERVDAGDADSNELPDITGDGAVDEADRDVVRGVDFSLPDGRPPGCADGHPTPDWQVTSPAVLDCGAGEAGVVILGGSGGGAPGPGRGLADPASASGLRWITVQIESALAAEGVASQLVVLTPGFNGTDGKALDAEAWALSYLRVALTTTPCLRVILIGHSFGGAMVETVALRLEVDGLGDRIILTVLIDSFNALYPGDREAMPQSSPVFNVYQTNDPLLRGRQIEQPNVENWDASAELAPEFGDAGGDALVPVLHTNIDNSQAVADRVWERAVERSCSMGLC